MEKKYIDQKEWINRLEEELKSTKDEQRKTYLNIWINAIKCQPTVDEKEIIRKSFERVVDRLEGKVKYYETLGDESNFPQSVIEHQNAYHYKKALKIVEEEGNFNENT